MKYLIALFGIVLIAGLVYFNKPENNPEPTPENAPFAMVQLFTSQGCSSCPKADKLLEEVKDNYKNRNVFLMSYHVDYWNRLGWEDPFSKKEYTQLQYDYSNKFNNRTVYTPQVVINGEIGFVGSNSSKMSSNLSTYLSKPAENTVSLSEVKNDKNMVSFNYKVGGKLSGKELKIALVIDEKTTQVKRGENGGRSLTNTNIVINEKKLKLSNSNGTGEITILGMAEPKDELSLIFYIQDANLNITGAGKIAITR